MASYYILPRVAEWLWIEQYQSRHLPATEMDALRTSAHERTAKAMLGMVRAEGGVFVKMGQHMCASPVLPKIYVDTLRVLMDQAIPRPLAETRQTWRDEFGRELEGEFSEFREEPLATASLAQVYEARLKEDGREVAVKVQHRDVARLFRVDMKITAAYYSLLGTFFPGLDFSFLVEELDRAFKEELDFELEARNGKRARQLFQRPGGNVVVPGVIDRLSSKKVLVMEFEEGFRVDNVAAMRKAGLDPRPVAGALIGLFSEMMFIHGFVHCDPHPGNILVRPAPGLPGGFQLVLLDHGTYQNLPNSVRLNFARLWKGVISANTQLVEEATEGFGIDRKHARFVGFALTFSPPMKDPMQVADDRLSQQEMEELAADLLDMEVADLQVQRAAAGEKMVELNQVFEKMPRELLLVMKTNNLLRFINEQLGSPVNRFSVMSRACLEGLSLNTGGASLKEGGLAPRTRLGDLGERTRTYLDLMRMRLIIWLHPLLQWVYIDVYLRLTAPKMRQLLLAKQGEGVSLLG